MEYWQRLIIVCGLVFFAGFMDSIAGGGGIISLPAYLIAGLPPSLARGSNKFSSIVGTATSSIKFIKGKKVDYPAALTASAAALIGSYLGSLLALEMDKLSGRYFQYMLLAVLPILAGFILKNKRVGSEGKKTLPKRKTLILSALAGFFIGGYDGFFGPGAGTFLIIVFNTLISFDVLTSSGNTKLVNFASNLAALFTFLLNGHVMFSLAAPAAVFSILGNLLGSRLAFKNGAKLIKPAFVVVLVLLLIKIAYDLFLA